MAHEVPVINQPIHCVLTLADDNTYTPKMASMKPNHLTDTVPLRFGMPSHPLFRLE